MQKTPLYYWHVENGGKVVDFAGWKLPVRYKELIFEHNTTRSHAGLFDVSHMGEILIKGKQAEDAVNYLTCNDISKIKPGRAQYSAFLNQTGGVIDDVIVYKKSQQEYLICVNASNTQKDFEWVNKNNIFDVEIINQSLQYGQIAIQGPKAETILSAINCSDNLKDLKYFSFVETKLNNLDVIVARTGYTGEDGFEIFVNWEDTVKLWKQIFEVGVSSNLVAVGLGARDTLRLEACYPLHGHELLESVSALDSGLEWIVKFAKTDFIGKQALVNYKNSGIKKELVAYELIEPGIARENTKVFKNGIEIGVVTSGTLTPTINKSIGMARISSEYALIEDLIELEIRGKRVKAKQVKKPFYKRKS